ncbi:MAG: phosphatase PAP2 family protein [Myxococcaceae bacterium]|nr:phosphatase PAP2 family protein [Myxococcaceae bacterium]
MGRVRPLEWVVAAFAAFVLVRAGPQAFLAWPALLTDRAGAVLAAWLVVALVQQAVHLKRSRRALPRWAPLTLAPSFLFLGLTLSDVELREALAGAPTLADALLVVGARVLFLAGWCTPAPLFAAWWALRQRGVPWGAQLWRSLVSAARDLGPVLFLLSGYSWMASVVAPPERDLDAVMAAADRALTLGGDPLHALEGLVRPALSEFLALVYASYALLIPICLGVLSFRRGAPWRESALAVGLMLALGYVSYTLVPVQGPLTTMHFTVPLELYLVREVKAALMDRLRITYDCFPSMHTALTVVLLVQCRRHAPRLARWVWPFAALMPLACVYLRYHYLVDVVAGLGLAMWVCALAPWLSALHECAALEQNAVGEHP